MAPDDQAPPNNQQYAEAAAGGPAGVGAIPYAEAAERLFDNGYEPLPIRPGKKYPTLEQWTQLPIDAAQVERWTRQFPRYGIGLRTGLLVGVDIDVLDPELAHAAATLAVERFGQALLRVGRWPKRLLLYRTDCSFPKRSITGVEILGRGQQFAAFGVHPDTKQPYAWPLGDSPLDVPLDQLPLVDQARCEALLAELAQLLPQAPPGARGRSRGPSNNATTPGPERDAEGRVVEGRDGWLSSIAFHAVHDALEAGRPLAADELTLAVWDRFCAATDLGRAKKDGRAHYGPGDAARKVADKLRLARDGRLPTRRQSVVEPPVLPPAKPVDEARSRLDDILVAACSGVAAWHASEAPGPAPQIGIRATVGLGKSATARRHLLALREELVTAGLPSRIVICTPSHVLAEEVAAEWRAEGASVAVWRGYEAKHPLKRRPMCGDLEAVRAAMQAGVDVHSAACAGTNGRRCTLFEGCLKQANRTEVANADIVVAPYDALFTGFAIQPESVAVMLIDEGCWARAQETISGLSVERLPYDLLNHDPTRRRPEAAFADTADLHALRAKLATACADNGPGPVSRSWLEKGGLTVGDAQIAAAFEQSRFRDPGLYPGMPRDARKLAMAQARINLRSRKLTALWEGARRLLEGSVEADGRIEIEPPDPETGQHGITILGVKPLHRNLRGRPVIHLDATLRPELARTILPLLAVEEIEAEAPHMQLRLVTGSFGKGTLCDDERASVAERQRRENRRSECVDYVRWHARRLAPANTLVVTYKDCEAAFAGIPGVEVAHFNAIAGLDVYRDVGLLIVIGRPLPREADVTRLSAAFFGHVPEGGYRFVQRGVQMRDGAVRAVRVMNHDDAQAEILRAAICDDEVIQAIGRGRGVNRRAEDPLEVHVLADVALPLLHDRLLCWATESPNIVQRMLLAGMAVDSPTDVVGLHPGLFSNADQAQKAFERAAFSRHFPLSNTYREMSAKSAAYRRPGKGRSWQRAYWIDGDAASAKAALERANGSLAEWRPD